MPIIPEVLEFADELTEIRRDIHAHPELGFEEERTADIVAAKLAEYGCEVHRGLATTGVVGTIRRGNSLRAIGLRADMDCLPMQELNEFAHRSTHDGKMHACGHDGHTTMLLGAARYLADDAQFRRHRAFHLPARRGRLRRRPGHGRRRGCSRNSRATRCSRCTTSRASRSAIWRRGRGRCSPRPTASTSASRRKGGHAAHPHSGTDPFVIGAQIVLALQTIAVAQCRPGRLGGDQRRLHARRLGLQRHPRRSAYRRHGAQLPARGAGPARAAHGRDRARHRRRCSAPTAELDYRRGYPPTINHADEADVRRRRRGRDLRRRQGQPQRRAVARRRGFLVHAAGGAGRDAVARQRPGRRRLLPAQRPLRFQRQRAAGRGQLFRPPRRALPRARPNRPASTGERRDESACRQRDARHARHRRADARPLRRFRPRRSRRRAFTACG